jgi:bacillolysin
MGIERRLLRWASGLLVLAASAVAGAAPTTAASAARIQALASEGHAAAFHRRTGRAVFLGAGARPPITLAALGLSARPKSGRATPQDFLDALGPGFGLADPASQARPARDRTTDEGKRSTRFRQHHRGVPVFAGEVIVNLDAEARLLSMTGRAAPELEVDTLPALDAADASRIALEAASKWHAIPVSGLVAAAPELSVFDPRLLDGAGAFAPLLAWQVEVASRDLEPVRELVLVDARSGTIVLHFNRIHDARSRLTYDGNGAPALPGTLACDESSVACAGAAADAVNAHTFAADTYDYYAANHGRDGIDGAGMTLVSTVRHCPVNGPCPYGNAFWNGAQMVYGAGFANADDVVAHEITHGVTEHESNLFYYYQSGAINESFSDLWGELIDQANGRGNDAAGVRWSIGEDLPVGVLRDMSNPPLHGDPDRMTDGRYYLGAGDGGGVHTNSGVNNKAAFLMVDGGSFNGRTVRGIGAAKTAKVYYRVQSALLVSGSDYLDLYNGLIQACHDLVGTGGIVVADCQSVRDAVEAVEMNLEPGGGADVASQCPAGQSVASTLFSDGLEGGTAQWRASRAVGAAGWASAADYAASGRFSLFGPDPASPGDLSVRMANAVVLPAGAHLWFSHAFGFEKDASRYYDGGVLEYSSDGGATWVDAAALHGAGKGYGGALAADTGNPLGGRAAFGGESRGYVASRYDLASLAGRTVAFRWRIGADQNVDAPGWWVDDVRIHTCAGPPVIAVTSAAGAAFRIGAAGTFTVTTSGSPAPLISVAGTLPAGLAFAPATATLSGTPLPGTAGLHGLVFTASNGAAASVAQSFQLDVARGGQAIALGAAPRLLLNGSATLAASGGSSGNPVTFASATPGICTVAGNRVSAIHAGTCTIAASQAGDASFDPAPAATQSFTVERLAQAIDFTALPERGLAAGSFGIAATGGASGNPVLFASLTPATCAVSGNVVILATPGLCTVSTSQAGNGDYAAAPTVLRSFTIAPVPPIAQPIAQAIDFPPLADRLLGGGGFTVTATGGGSANAVTFSALTPATCTVASNAVALVSAGVCTLAANQAGDARHAAAPQVTRWFTIGLPGVLAVSASALDFGAASAGTRAADESVTLTNTGGALVSIRGMTVSDRQFAVSHDCATLAPAQSCTVRISFAPAAFAGPLNAVMPVSGALSIANDGAGGPLAVSVAGLAEKSLVTHYYRSILRRPADAAGKAFWTGEAARVAALGARTDEAWFAMAASFFASHEYAAFARTPDEFVGDLYRTFFNRPADDAGLVYWSSQIAAGIPREAVLVSFLFSAELAGFTRGLFDAAPARAEVDTVVDFYRGLLLRLPDDAGFRFWERQFRAAQCAGGAEVIAATGNISAGFAVSPEHLARARSNGQYVADLYNAFLRRGADLAGVGFWIAQLDSGAMTRDQMRRQFLASPEFTARAEAIVAQGCLAGPS